MHIALIALQKYVFFYVFQCLVVLILAILFYISS